METVAQGIFCGDCGEVLPTDWISNAKLQRSCLTCGSKQFKIVMAIEETAKIEVHDQMRAKVKDHTRRSKDKLRQDVIAGDDFRVSEGDYVDKLRVIDRDQKSYKEKIVDKKTGEVIRDVEHPLSDHTGHGSAKPEV